MLTLAITLSKIGKIEFKYYAIFTHFKKNIKPMKGSAVLKHEHDG